MARVFVSYARDDRDWVARFSEVLSKASGAEIWWDRSILPGEQFDEAIEGALEQAACVLVVWSGRSVKSRWVRSEARMAANRAVLVPLRIEDVSLPLEFNSYETQNLTSWTGDPADGEFLELVETVRAMVERAPSTPEAELTPGDPQKGWPLSDKLRTGTRPWRWRSRGFAVLVVIALA